MEFLFYTISILATLMVVDSMTVPAFGFIEGISGGRKSKTCATFANPEFVSAKNENDAEYYPLRDWTSSTENCENFLNQSRSYLTEHSPIDSRIVAFNFYNCSLIEAALAVQRLGGKGMVLVAQFTVMRQPSSEVMKQEGVVIPTAIISSRSFKTIQTLGNVISVKEYLPPRAFYMDYAPFIIWLISMLSLTLGTFWNQYIHLPLNRSSEENINYEVNGNGTDKNSEETKANKEKKVEKIVEDVDDAKITARERNKRFGMTLIKLVILLMVLTAIQVLLYYFFEVTIYVVYALFFLITVPSAMGLLSTFKFLLPCLAFELNCGKRSVDLRQIFIFCLAVGMFTTWVVLRMESYAWILQDTLIVIAVVRTMGQIHIYDLKTYAVSFVLLAIYFTFIIFGTAVMTPEGKSILEVAIVGKGGPEANVDREKMPMTLKVPQITNDPISYCLHRESAVSLIDIIVPGGLVSFCYRFGCKMGGRFGYFFVSISGFGVGLIVTFIVQFMTRHPQPALLYITPFMFGGIAIYSFIRKELADIWNGEPVVSDENNVQDVSYVKKA
ncbi:Signal peptide peptidase-like 2A, variant 2 [Chamberlinius hualienensis]